MSDLVILAVSDLEVSDFEGSDFDISGEVSEDMLREESVDPGSCVVVVVVEDLTVLSSAFARAKAKIVLKLRDAIAINFFMGSPFLSLSFAGINCNQGATGNHPARWVNL